MKYEMIREIFNECSNNQMRDVDVSTIEIQDLDRFMDKYRRGSDIQETRTVEADGTIVFDLIVDGLHQRISFSEDD